MRKRVRPYLLALAFSIFLMDLCSGQQIFPRIVFLEPPYTTPQERMSYIAQIDSMKAKYVVVGAVADSVATSNPYGIGFFGSDTLLKTSRLYYEFGYYINRSTFMELEAENTDLERKGYIFQHSTGQLDPTDLVSWKGQTGRDAPGYLIHQFSGVKNYTATYNWLDAYFRLKVSDNTTPDSVCKIEIFSDTIYNNSKVIYADSFLASNTYQDFVIKLPVYPYRPFDLKVYWYGNQDLWVDKVKVEDYYFARSLLSLDPDSVRNVFKSFYSRINNANHFRFYPNDEPAPSQFLMHKWFDDYAKSVYPHKQSTAIINFHPLYLDVYVNDVQPKEIFLDYYVINNVTDSASTGPNNIQLALDDLTSKVKIYSEKSKSYNLPLWFMLQAGAWKDDNGTIMNRDPNPAELRAQAYLAIAYGVNGLGYFLYPTFYHGYRSYRCNGTSTDWCFHGLVDKNFTTGRYEPNYKWYVVQEINEVVDSLDYIYADPGNWQGATKSDSVRDFIMRDGTPSFIDSVVSQSGKEEYVEVAFFNDSTASLYGKDFLLVNRRCLSNENDFFKVYIKNKTTIQGYRNQDYIYISDVYRDKVVDRVLGVSGPVYTTLYLGPGEGKLFRMDKLIPPALTGTAILSPRGIRLDWNPVFIADKYIINRSATGGSGDKTYVVDDPQISYYDEDSLQGSEDYEYRIRTVVNGCGFDSANCFSDTSGYSNVIIVHNLPDVPRNLTGVVSTVESPLAKELNPVILESASQFPTNRVELSWQSPVNQKPNTIAYYKIKVSCNGWQKWYGPVADTFYTLCLDYNRVYNFNVYTFDNSGDSSDASNTATVTTGGYLYPGCPALNGKNLPENHSISQNYPNPFNSVTFISYALPENEFVKIEVYNILGQKIKTLVEEFQAAGYKNTLWDGKNESGQDVASGVYFYRLKAGDFTETKKMTLLK